MDYIWPKGNTERLMKTFSLREFGMIVGEYKRIFKEQIRAPTADNNHIINYNLKLTNYLMMNEFIHMVSAGAGVYAIKGLVGNYIDRFTLNYLGQRRQLYGLIFIYGFSFWYMLKWLDTRSRLDINRLVNAREFNGEVIMNIVLRHFPQKVNQEKYRQLLMEKYE